MIAASLTVLLLMMPEGDFGRPLPRALQDADAHCIVMGMPTEERLSPLDSLTFRIDGHAVKICFGRPSARGRTMIGGREVPYGKLWRTGANEPTMIHTSIPLSVAGIEIGPGSYSLYTIPGESDWVLIVNSSITQWGHIAEYSSKVKAQEMGSAEVHSERLDDHVETMTFKTETGPGGETVLLLEWEHTRVSIPIAARE